MDGAELCSLPLMGAHKVANWSPENMTPDTGSSFNKTITELPSAMNVTEKDRQLVIVMKYIDLYLRIVFVCVLSFFALTTNIMNITILIKQGIHSCVSLCLICLSVTDFLSTFAGLCTIPPKVMVYLKKRNEIDPYAVYFFVVYMSAIFHDISNMLTAFLSLERCLCVCLPFKFKDIFTIRRCVAAVFGCYLLCFGIYMPHFLSSGLEKKTSESGNSTYLGLWLSADRTEVDNYINITVQFCLTTFNMVVVCVCTILMTISLKHSSRFQGGKTNGGNRSKSVSVEKTAESSNSIPLSASDNGEQRSTSKKQISFLSNDVNAVERVKRKRTSLLKKQSNKQALYDLSSNCHETERLGSSTEASKHRKNVQSSRNINVMKTTIVLCVICFVSNFVRLALTTSSFVEPRLRFGRAYDHWYQILISIAYVFQLLNCSLNIFVYYRFNKSFRKTYQRVFCCKQFSE